MSAARFPTTLDPIDVARCCSAESIGGTRDEDATHVMLLAKESKTSGRKSVD
jgi:hypothetical protein